MPNSLVPAGFRTSRALLFTALLALYAALILGFSPTGPYGDEGRYVRFADNLLTGYFSPPDHINLANGPGYPLLLAPIRAITGSMLPLRLLNGLLLLAGAAFLAGALRSHLDARLAYGIAAAVALYPPMLRYLPLAVSEIAAVFWTCAFAYFVMAGRRRHVRFGWRDVAAGMCLGGLALTKAIFGYVVPALGLLLAAAALAPGRRALVRGVMTCAVALLVSLPYLVYTYRLTGRAYYWATYGGSSLYWMTTPFPDEYGDWLGNSIDQIRLRDRPELSARHAPLFERLSAMNQVEADQELKDAALANLRRSPGKFVRNWVANCGRLAFGFPHSYGAQGPGALLYAFSNSVLLGLLLPAGALALLRRPRLPAGTGTLLLFAVLSLAAASVVSAYPRHLFPAVPPLAVWGALVLHATVALRPRFENPRLLERSAGAYPAAARGDST